MTHNSAETTRTLKAILRKQFPACKFSITRGGERVEWTDDGPTQIDVEEAILAAGLAEISYGYDGRRWLKLHGRDTIGFDRYNAAEREAWRQDLERRSQESRAFDQHVASVIHSALEAKRAAVAPAPNYAPEAISDSAVFEAFERLRQRAESEVFIQDTADRRPSWAPPLILGEELGTICCELGYLSGDDKWIARLWAQFATPKRSGTWLREHASTLPLAGLACRGFQLHIGGTRGPLENMLFEAQRRESGTWRFGPTHRFFNYTSPHRREWERLISERERAPTIYNTEQAKACVAECTRMIAAIDVEDLAAAKAHRHRQNLRARALELAQARVLDFIGAPDAQMQLAARLWGHCCICGKGLTDPVSLERGIGPDCYAKKIVRFIHDNANRPIDWLVCWSGMPREFVVEVLHEQEARP
jgi:hypothetical protein